MRIGVTLLLIGSIWLVWIIALAGYPTILPFIMTACGSLIILVSLIRTNTHSGRAMSPFTLNALGFFAWGALVSLGMFFMMTANVAMVMGRHRIHLPEFVYTVWDAIYLTISVPAMWIRPSTIFDNFLWTFLSIFIFWGLVLQGLLIAYKRGLGVRGLGGLGVTSRHYTNTLPG